MVKASQTRALEVINAAELALEFPATVRLPMLVAPALECPACASCILQHAVA